MDCYTNLLRECRNIPCSDNELTYPQDAGYSGVILVRMLPVLRKQNSLVRLTSLLE